MSGSDEPKKPTPFVEAVAAKTARPADDIRAEVWLAALERHEGNVTAASTEFGFTKQRGSALTKRHGLVERAAELRKAAGQPRTGRPRGRKAVKTG